MIHLFSGEGSWLGHVSFRSWAGKYTLGRCISADELGFRWGLLHVHCQGGVCVGGVSEVDPRRLPDVSFSLS